MALNPKLAEAAANAEADAVCALLNGGKLQIYDGTQPATADDAVGAQVLLAELTFGSPAFASASGGVAAANAIAPDTDANATGAASWFRCLKSDLTKVWDGTVGATSGFNLNLNSTAIQIHAAVTVTAFSFTAPKSA
jgi:hypothetical protein